MEKIISTFKYLNIPYDEGLIEKFQRHMELILEWNQKINLTAVLNENDFIRIHYLDSLLPYHMEAIKEAHTILDMGTGAGFPGVPLAMVYPEKSFYLVDSVKKKLKVIEDIASELNIKNITLIHGRAEELAYDRNHRGFYDVCVSRAVAELSVLCEYCLPYVKIGGTFLPYKTAKAQEEINDSLKSIELLGGRLEDKKTFSHEAFDAEHWVLEIKKVKNTPSKYPRKAGIPKKQPLK